MGLPGDRTRGLLAVGDSTSACVRPSEPLSGRFLHFVGSTAGAGAPLGIALLADVNTGEPLRGTETADGEEALDGMSPATGLIIVGGVVFETFG